MKSKLAGIVPPVVTPLSERDALDIAGAERLLEHMIAGGVHGLFILGTTGEAPSLSYRLRREWVKRACNIVKGRVPVLVGVTDTSFVETVALARYAEECGAEAVVLSTPYYFPAGQTELCGYVENLAPELPLPLVLYNMPSLTKVWFEIDSLKRLSAIPNIIGVKDSSGDLHYFEQVVSLVQERPDWFVLIGPEAYLPASLRLGGNGGVNGGANIFPSLFVECYQAFVDGDSDRVDQLQSEIDDLQRIYEIGKYASRFIKATKCALSLLDICDDFMAEPFHRFKAPERERVDAVLKSLVFSQAT